MPKFWSMPILWTHATHAKISTHAIHVIFLTQAKILWTHATHAKISTHATYAISLTHAKILQTHATHAKVSPKPPMNPRTHAPMLLRLPLNPRHPRYLADSHHWHFNHFEEELKTLYCRSIQQQICATKTLDKRS